ncbi:DUF2155 domain-containing protein [uncultured Sneathiella sp.]|uniref:DUF2155 domain-containing protein n=1 Tax=uncultured Sneathiella sp. TaxID=879315 RepID=UPI00259883AD|nr:DUF2155 domain-containing protein [uncultured Sneathiella sp.]
MWFRISNRRRLQQLALLSLLGLVAVNLQPRLGNAADSLEGDIVILRALDKVTARTKDLFVPIDETAIFGSLAVRPRKCLKRPPEEPPETSAFLEISEVRVDDDNLPLFTGWMFASSPAINALEHPVYDVWVIDCKISAPVTPSPKE